MRQSGCFFFMGLLFAALLFGCGDSSASNRDTGEGDDTVESDGGGDTDLGDTDPGDADPGDVDPEDGDPDGENPLDGLMSVRIEPLDQVVTATPTAPGTVQYTVYGTFPDGERDVTQYAGLNLSNPSLGSIANAAFTSTTAAGGTTQVRATVGGQMTETQLTVLFEHAITGPDNGNPIPANPADQFVNNDPSLSPELVYPNNGTMLPPNLSILEIHWIPAGGTDLFELRFESATIGMSVYLRCDQQVNGGCIHELSNEAYQYLARSTGGEGPVSVIASGSDEQGNFGSSQEFTIEFAQESVQGGVYYWTTSNGTAIMRFDFGADVPNPEIFVSRDDDPELGTCVGCHALSPDGRKIVMSKGGQNDGRIVFLNDVGAPDTFTRNVTDGNDTASLIQFAAWNPDASRFAAIYGDTDAPARNRIHFHDGNTGVRNGDETIQLDWEPSHIAWSPDGSMLGASRVGKHQTSQRPKNCGVEVIPADGQGGWMASQTIVPIEGGKNRYNPTFAPDSSFMLYSESICPGGDIDNGDCDGDADPPAKTWAVQPNPGATPILMGNASAPGVRDDGNTNLSDTFPRFSPFEKPQGDGRIMWATISSRRQVGLRDPSGRQLLWMFAVDPDKVLAGEDGSFAAFYLPFQDFGTSNHIAQWTQEIIINPN